ncbi:MAG: Rrf2 family transcriptional regulator [Candidatus Marinimicrobia bacterium]|nr:Rrf2 family transcriptional regulator [Candidatus Neomarinimicrobiota bacterium]
MLKISTKGRYGLRLMVRMARNYGKGPILLSDLSQMENISLKYAEHLIRLLKPTQLLLSYRGATGGYELAKPPEEISVRLIVEALEGRDYPVNCVHSPQICPISDKCPSRIVWNKLEEAIVQTLDQIRLGELVTDND